MKASLAREIQQNTIDQIDRQEREELGDHLESAYRDIQMAAEDGAGFVKVTLNDHGKGIPYRLEDALLNVLQRDGYAVSHEHFNTRIIKW